MTCPHPQPCIDSISRYVFTILGKFLGNIWVLDILFNYISKQASFFLNSDRTFNFISAYISFRLSLIPRKSAEIELVFKLVCNYFIAKIPIGLGFRLIRELRLLLRVVCCFQVGKTCPLKLLFFKNLV